MACFRYCVISHNLLCFQQVLSMSMPLCHHLVGGGGCHDIYLIMVSIVFAMSD